MGRQRVNVECIVEGSGDLSPMLPHGAKNLFRSVADGFSKRSIDGRAARLIAKLAHPLNLPAQHEVTSGQIEEILRKGANLAPGLDGITSNIWKWLRT